MLPTRDCQISGNFLQNTKCWPQNAFVKISKWDVLPPGNETSLQKCCQSAVFHWTQIFFKSGRNHMCIVNNMTVTAEGIEADDRKSGLCMFPQHGSKTITSPTTIWFWNPLVYSDFHLWHSHQHNVESRWEGSLVNPVMIQSINQQHIEISSLVNGGYVFLQTSGLDVGSQGFPTSGRETPHHHPAAFCIRMQNDAFCIQKHNAF